jgi:hypothetical protein
MKKTLYTIAFVALFCAFSNAQAPASKATKQNAKAQPAPAASSDAAANPAVAPAASSDNAQPATSATDAKPATSASDAKPAGGTRMAITEKGVPAPKKTSEAKKSEPAKAEKH